MDAVHLIVYQLQAHESRLEVSEKSEPKSLGLLNSNILISSEVTCKWFSTVLMPGN